jgi:hypothetical protein
VLITQLVLAVLRNFLNTRGQNDSSKSKSDLIMETSKYSPILDDNKTFLIINLQGIEDLAG